MIRVVHALGWNCCGEMLRPCSTSLAWGEAQWPGILGEARMSCTAFFACGQAAWSAQTYWQVLFTCYVLLGWAPMAELRIYNTGKQELHNMPKPQMSTHAP